MRRTPFILCTVPVFFFQNGVIFSLFHVLFLPEESAYIIHLEFYDNPPSVLLDKTFLVEL